MFIQNTKTRKNSFGHREETLTNTSFTPANVLSDDFSYLLSIDQIVTSTDVTDLWTSLKENIEQYLHFEEYV